METTIYVNSGPTGKAVTPAPGTHPVRVGAGWYVTVRNQSAGHPLAANQNPTFDMWIPDHAVTEIKFPTAGMITAINGGYFPMPLEDPPCLCGAAESEHFTRTGTLTELGKVCAVTGENQS